MDGQLEAARIKVATVQVEKTSAETAKIQAEVAAAKAQLALEGERKHVAQQLEIAKLQAMVEAANLVQKEREEASIARREDMKRADEERAAHNAAMHRRHEEFTKLLLEQAATTIKIQQEQASMEMQMSMQHSHSMLHGVAIGKCQGKLELLQINVQLSACAHCMPHGVFQHNNQRFVFFVSTCRRQWLVIGQV